MSRSVVNNQTRRCERCRFTPRWCVCAAHTAIACPLAVDVLMHHKEVHRPTSTGLLINRVMPASRRHLYRQDAPPARATVALPGRELWILHPRGEEIPPAADPAGLQVVLLDGSWGEAARMAGHVAGWGRLVRLPEAGSSRNTLRRQELPGKYSTVESLLFLLGALGLAETERALRLQFELHVYAGLRTRGATGLAAEFLAASALPAAFPELLAEMHRRRPLI